MMDAHEKIYKVLSELGYDVEFDTYTGKNATYITYFELLEKADAGSDDSEEIIGHHFQVDVFSKDDPTDIKNKIVQALKENEFYSITCQDLYERENKIFHKAIDCYYAEYKY